MTAWYAISSEVIIGPYFFEESNHAVTTNNGPYVNMIQEFLEPQPQQINLGLLWFQQDGVTTHTARNSMTILREMCLGHLISMYGTCLPWPARSSNLTPCNFFYESTSRIRCISIVPGP